MTMFSLLQEKNRLGQIISEHYFALLLSIVAAILVAIPQIIAIQSIGDRFQGIYPFVIDDDSYYQARAREVLDGDIDISNPYLLEYKDTPPLQFWIPDYAVALTARLFQVSIPQMFVIADFVLPPLLFLLTYTWLFFLSRDKLAALGGSTFLVFGLFIDEFTRLPSPQLNFIFFLLFLITTFLAFERKTFQWVVMSGMCLGLLFHVYTYYWTYAVVFLGLLVICAARYVSWGFVGKIFLILFIGSIIGLPYFYQTWISMNQPFYAETLARVGLIHTHFPSGILIVGWGTVTLLTFILFMYKGIIPNRPESLFVLSMVFAAIISVNQHVITGLNLEFSSHYQMVALYAFVGMGVLLFSYLYAYIPNRKTLITLMIAVVAIFSLNNVVRRVDARYLLHPGWIDAQRFAPTFAWIDANLPAGTIIYTDFNLSNYLPIYTSANVLYERNANLHFMPNDDVKRRFLINSFFVSNVDEQYLQQFERYIWGVYYIDRWGHAIQKEKALSLLGITYNKPERLPASEIESVLHEYRVMRELPFQCLIGAYNIEYMLIDRLNKTWVNPIASLESEIVWSRDNLELHRIDTRGCFDQSI